MSESVIIFENVYKSYPTYHHITAGFKNFLLNFSKALKVYQQRHIVLRGISFEVKKGECVGFIGRNGAGKSTLLGLTARVLKPDSGKIVVKGRVSPLLELGAGFHPDLTGRENIILNGVLLGMPKKKFYQK
jgi:lipopolysaccharide transport system ATP-binding protein